MQLSFLSLLGLASYVAGLTISEVNGPAVLSPFADQELTLSGIVTAVSSSGFYVRDKAVPRGKRTAASSSIYVHGSQSAKLVAPGDEISLAGQVTEYRSSRDYIPLTEITAPTNVTVLSTGNAITPILLGKRGLQPPTDSYSALDNGDVFGIPNNVTLYSAANRALAPSKHGLDFWESLTGELVHIDAPTAVSGSNRYGDVWIRGSWRVTGLNSRGGLTLTGDRKGNDANPEAIIIGSPLDGSRNAPAKLGDTLEPFTGVVSYAFGFYRILPTTGLRIRTSPVATAPPTRYTSTSTCRGLTIAHYNVENLNPTSPHLPGIAAHIADVLRTPDLLFLQEIQDSDGPANTGEVSANATLSALTAAIAARSGLLYATADVPPANNADGGAPGSNIRVAYLYNPSVLTLTPSDAPADAPATLTPALTLAPNPARIAPAAPAFADSRKPLAARFDVRGSTRPLFAVNVHFSSKGGSSSLHGDARPPVNGGVDARAAQLHETAAFVREVLARDPGARLVVAGDWNEFASVAPMKEFASVTGLREVDEVVGIRREERYSYVFDGNCQALDHMYVSRAVARGARGYEHVHVNTWAGEEQVSDHDPAVGVFDVC